MELYLIRHGLAGDRQDYERDEERPLTPKGEIKTEKIAQRLQGIGVHFDLILSSPLKRAEQTAQILLAAGLGDRLETHPCLAPDGLLQDWLNWLSHDHYNQSQSCIALVGHQPNLGDWAESLVWGDIQNKLILKKGGIIGISLPSTDNLIAQGELFLLTAPRWLL